MADEKKAAADKADKPAKKPAAKKVAASSETTAAKKPAAKKPAAKKAPAKSESAAADSAPASAAKKAPAAKSSSSTTAASKPAAKKAAATEAESTDKAAKVTTLKMHHLRPAEGSHARKIRVGRGEGGRKGKTAGRGTKGTGARYQVPERFEGGQTPIHMRIPKLPGFRNPFRTEYQVVNVSQIAELFPKGGKVTKADLVDKGAVRKNQLVKVLGDGDISVKVEIVDADKVSQSAKTKIEAAGGSVNES
ncbi:50S ribosomal protein L15 [Demequina sp. SO4-13]|uniref:50S ribosomal protein L15 n=1 Tax=Demequina sp. SO4-13 TaxID=3401027 RepID=UPI003AF9A46C